MNRMQPVCFRFHREPECPAYGRVEVIIANRTWIVADRYPVQQLVDRIIAGRGRFAEAARGRPSGSLTNDDAVPLVAQGQPLRPLTGW